MGGGRRRRQGSTETLVPEVDGEEGEAAEAKGFFACYLLCSLSPRHKGHTYIGFTVNPRRRIRQHNGEITSGALRTKRKRPWEMILCIYGFPTNVNALQFEWAWQHPRESLAVRKAAESFKSLSGIANKIKIAYTMLTLPNWEKFNLTVNFFSSKYVQHAVGCPKLPKNMRVNVCIMDDLPCYMNGQILGDNEELDDDEFRDDEEDESLESIVNQPENEKNPLEKTFEDWDGPSKPADDSIHPFDYDYFVRSPVRTQIGYSWQIESHDPVQQSEFADDCPRTPIKLDSGGNSREDATVSSSSCSANHSNQTTSMESSILEPSTPMTSGADKNTRKLGCMSPTENDVINLLTPSSCIILSEEKRPRVRRQIIDLTESPEVIHL